MAALELVGTGYIHCILSQKLAHVALKHQQRDCADFEHTWKCSELVARVPTYIEPVTVGGHCKGCCL
jgi:hypothetical protein